MGEALVQREASPVMSQYFNVQGFSQEMRIREVGRFFPGHRKRKAMVIVIAIAILRIHVVFQKIVFHRMGLDFHKNTTL